MEHPIFYYIWRDKPVDMAEELLERNFLRCRFWCPRRRIHIDVYFPFRVMVDAGIVVVSIINVIQSRRKKFL